MRVLALDTTSAPEAWRSSTTDGLLRRATRAMRRARTASGCRASSRRSARRLAVESMCSPSPRARDRSRACGSASRRCRASRSCSRRPVAAVSALEAHAQLGEPRLRRRRARRRWIDAQRGDVFSRALPRRRRAAVHAASGWSSSRRRPSRDPARTLARLGGLSGRSRRSSSATAPCAIETRAAASEPRSPGGCPPPMPIAGAIGCMAARARRREGCAVPPGRSRRCTSAARCGTAPRRPRATLSPMAELHHRAPVVAVAKSTRSSPIEQAIVHEPVDARDVPRGAREHRRVATSTSRERRGGETDRLLLLLARARGAAHQQPGRAARVSPSRHRHGAAASRARRTARGSARTARRSKSGVRTSRAQKLYEKFGFTVAGVRRGYYSNPLEDALVLVARRTRRDLQGLWPCVTFG